MSKNSESTDQNSYGQILKASSLVGGAEAVSVLLGFVRMKFAAVLIGPVGVGLAGAYMAAQTLVGTVAGLGIQNSAVRDVAAAASRNDELRIGETVRALRRVVWITGMIGTLSMALLSNWLSLWTFGTDEHAFQIALLGIAVLFGNVQAGQTALIQGMRRIADLARLKIFTGMVGTVATVGFYWQFGIQGIIPALLATSFLGLCVATIYARRVPVPEVELGWRRTVELTGGMVRLGLAFMWAAVLTALVAYFARALVTQQLGLAEVGFYAAAFALSGVFVNFVLTAMGADYYPRLTAAADDPAQMERLINEQTEIGILLAAPGLLLIMALAPMILLVFYTKEFLPAADLLQWFLIGCMGRVISWPLGFVLIAQGRGRLFAITESLAQVLHMILIWLGLLWLGLQGTALAFALLYVLYTVMIRVVVGRLIHFSWSGSVIGLTTLCLAASAVIFLFGELPDSNVGIALGSITALVMGVLCSRALFRRLGSEHRLARIAASVPGGRCLFGLQPG